jgi:hypothetical protein
MRKLLGQGLLLTLTSAAVAQDVPKAEVFGGYSYASADVLLGQRANLNGWNASAAVNLNRWFGLVTDSNKIIPAAQADHSVTGKKM